MKQDEKVTVSGDTPVEPKPGSGYWQVPNAYYKKIRKLSMNEVREECMRLAGALMDQRNANYVLMQKLNEATKASQNQPKEGQSNEK